MLGSLRVRLPLVFLAGIVLAGVITTAIAIRLFQQFAAEPDALEAEPRGERDRRALLERGQRELRTGKKPIARRRTFAAANLERATGDRIYFVGPNPSPAEDAASGAAAIDDRLDVRQVAQLRVHAAGPRSSVPRGCEPDRARTGTSSARSSSRRRRPTSEHRSNSLIERLAIAGAARPADGGAARRGTCRGASCGRSCSSRDAVDEVAAGNYDVEVPPNAPGELGHLSARVGEMAHRLGEVEQMERNFLMSVSHELRTPLTAIRGHVAALLEGVIEDPELSAAARSRSSQAETQRLERLVGDILDLAKLDTHRFTVTHEEVDMATLIEQAYERYRDEAQRRSIDYRAELDDRPGDRLRRRPRAPGRRQPALERVPRDAGRRTHLARARAAERHRARRGRGHWAGHPARERASGSSGRSSRT